MLFGVIAACCIHCALWFNIYGNTALGESPSLDSRQTLELAISMANGLLPEEPFHRAPAYTFLLSLWVHLGASFETLTIIARLMNAIALAICAASAAICASRLWQSSTAGWIAGLLIALNPVLIFFAGDAFDILLASAALAVAITLLQQWIPERSIKGTLAIGLLLAVGASLRSHLLPLALLWLAVAPIVAKRNRHWHIFASLGPLVVSFAILGAVNLHISGDFRIMPWQGAYSLWSGNGPNADGRIFKQTIHVKFDGAYDNPAKVESIKLYEMETGKTPPHSISEMNAHWRTKTLNHIASQPLEWLNLTFRKAYYLLNNYEQYDNKTYGFHKKRHTLLNWNPIHWGALLLCAVIGALLAYRDPKTRAFTATLTVIFAIYAAGTILFYTSNRFRIPLVPVLSILSAGIVILPSTWRGLSRAWRISILSCGTATLIITYSAFFEAHSKDTWLEDYALLANAALRTQRDAEAIKYAEIALAMNPQRMDLHANLAQARFNLWAFAQNGVEINAQEAKHHLHSLQLGQSIEPNLNAILGIYYWKLGENAKAIEAWNSTASSDALARLCLYWNQISSAPTQDELVAYQQHPSYPLLVVLAYNHEMTAEIEAAIEFLENLLSPID